MSLKKMACYDMVPNDLTRPAPRPNIYRQYARAAKKMSRKGRCDCCELRVRIKNDGRTYKHGVNGITCAGSGHRPRDIEINCHDCGRPTAYNPITRKLKVHLIPYQGDEDETCPASLSNI